MTSIGKNFMGNLAIMSVIFMTGYTLPAFLHYFVDGPNVPSEAYPHECPKGINGPSEIFR